MSESQDSLWANRSVIIAATILFAVSFFLAAYGGGAPESGSGMKGYDCAKVVLQIMTFTNEDLTKSMTWDAYFYFSIFNLANFLFPAVLAASLKAGEERRYPRLLADVQVVSLAHVVNWAFHNAYEGKIDDLRLGYYLWLASMIIALLHAFAKENPDDKRENGAVIRGIIAAVAFAASTSLWIFSGK